MTYIQKIIEVKYSSFKEITGMKSMMTFLNTLQIMCIHEVKISELSKASIKENTKASTKATGTKMLVTN